MKSSIASLAIITLFVGPVFSQDDPPNPCPECPPCTNCPVNILTHQYPTNAIGYPVVRLSAIRASPTNILGTGFTVATNYGFEIVGTNYLTSRYETLASFNNEKYFHFYVAATNTDPARRYTLLNSEHLNGFYYPLDLGWNGLGTNGEYQLNGFVTLANEFDSRFFRVKDIGAAQ